MLTAVTLVDPSGGTISEPSYVPILDPYRDSNKQQIGAPKEKMQTTLYQVKDLNNIMALIEIIVDEADH